MKRTIFVGLIVILAFSNVYSQKESDPVLLTVDGEDVTKSEFLRVYNKNNVDNEVIDKKSIEEYLDLYIKFKLKVKEAENQKLDTLESFKKELQGYRKQLAKPYLIDSEVTENLIEEAYERYKYDLRASHILIKLPKDPSPKDTLDAYNKIMKIRKSIVDGDKTFEEAAIEESEDPSAKDRPATKRRPARKGNKGDLGYFTAFNMVYPFESAAYNLEEGELSKPIRTMYGYHLIKLKEKRDAMGVATVAHIFLKSNNEENNDTVDKKEFAYEIYEKLQNGEDFAKLAKEYSEDKGTAYNGGLLKPFSVNRIIPDFVEQVYKLKSGEYSEPFKSQWGWHIIKLHKLHKYGTFDEEKSRIKSNLDRDKRSSLSKKSAFEKIKMDYNYKLMEDALQEVIDAVDTSIFDKAWKIPENKTFDKTLFKLQETEFTQKEFVEYLFKNQTKHILKNDKISTYVKTMYDAWLEKVAFDFADKHLEATYPDFKNLMKEYRDGMLLFEITDKNVWTKAVKDTTGLKTFYEKNKSNYMWGKRLKATVYYTKNEDIAKKAHKLVSKAEKKDLSNEDILKEINEDNESNLSIEEDLFSKGDNDIIDEIAWEVGVTEPIKRQSKIVFIKVDEIINPEPKKLDEARGLITADYQDYLEEKWVESLKKKYSYKVHKDVLKSIK